MLTPTLPDGLRLDLTDTRIRPRDRRDIVLGRAERAELRYVRRFVKGDHDIVELGASLGILGSRAVRKLLPGRRYVGIEMVPWAAQIAERNIRRYAPPNVRVTVQCAAICSVMQRVGIYDPGSVFGSGAMMGDETECVTLSHILAEYDIREGYTLLMDIEGSESDVIRNDRAALATCGRMIVELHDAGPTGINPWGCPLDEALLSLDALGFRIEDARPPVYHLRNRHD